jgi:hypothetical protein
MLFTVCRFEYHLPCSQYIYKTALHKTSKEHVTMIHWSTSYIAHSFMLLPLFLKKSVLLTTRVKLVCEPCAAKQRLRKHVYVEMRFLDKQSVAR